MTRVLCVVAHPDDELGCLGMLLRSQEQGDEVAVGYVGEGRPGGGEQCAGARRLAAQRRWQIYGPLSQFVRPDNALDQVGLLSIVVDVEQWLREWQPELVLTHHAGDLNVDHRLVHQAVVTATRPVPGQGVGTVLAFEVPSSTEWAFGGGYVPFAPTVFVDISTTLDAKLAALPCYESELRPWPHPRSPAAVRARAAYWGQVTGVEAAEAFVLVRELRR